MVKKLFVPIVGIVLVAAVLAAPARAEYPEKPVTIVSPYGAGGNADLAARSLAAVTDKYLGKKALVINKTGAGGITGSSYVLESKNDGYTLLLARVGTQAVRPAMDSSTPYKWDDFTILGMLEINPFVCVVTNDSPIKNFNDLTKILKQSPGKLNYASTSVMDATVVFPVTIFRNLGLGPDAAIKVPYQGGGAALTAVVGKQVDFGCNGIAPYASGLKSGSLRALVVSTKERVPEAPYAPTGAEVGMPNLEVVSGWSALYGPGNLPKEIVDKWVDVLAKVSKDKEWVKLVTNRGSIPAIWSPQETRTFVQSQFQTFRDMATELGVFKQKK